MLCLAICAAPSSAEEPTLRDRVALYRFQPTPRPPVDSLEQQKAFLYRDQLLSQRRQLERSRSRGGVDASYLRQLGRTSRELDRVDQMLGR
jgi:hypothetical protein